MNKHVLLYIILILPILMGGSCEKRKFDFIGNAKLTKTVNVDITDSFSKTLIVSSSEIRKFLDDLPEDAIVTDVKIPSLSLRIIPRESNEVRLFSISGSITDEVSKKDLFSGANYQVPLIKPDSFLGINTII